MVQKTYRIDELAKDWKVNPWTIRREITRGHLDAFKVGVTWRIRAEEAEKYYSKQQNSKKIDSV